MRIDLNSSRIGFIKKSFLKRLLKNDYTKDILSSINKGYNETPYKTSKKSLIIDAIKMIGLLEGTNDELLKKMEQH